MRDLRDVGGTKGGVGWFLGGLAMMIAGLYLLMQQVTVHGGYWGSGSGWGRVGGGGGMSFGLTLVPLLVGVAILFFDGKSRLGWLLVGGGLLIIPPASSPACRSTSAAPACSTPS